MTKKHLIGILIAIASFGAHAQGQERPVEYTEKVGESFADWMKNSPAEAAVLNLYDGFTEPTVNYTDANGQPAQLTDFLTMYIAKAKTELKVPASAVNLKAMITIENLNAIDPMMQSRPITPDKLMQNVVAAGKPVTNFEWCAPGTDDILKPKAEKDLSYLNGKQFCSGAPNSICVETCISFNWKWKGVISAAGGAKNGLAQGEAGLNAIKNLVAGGQAKTDTSNRREDRAMALQSEVRYYTSDAEYGKPLAGLTGINTPVRGVVEQTMFYYNQVFKYSKVLSIVQDNPDPSKGAIMTNVLVMGVRTHSWKKPTLADHLKGEGFLNSEGEGMTDGIPLFLQSMTRKIAGILETGG